MATTAPVDAGAVRASESGDGNYSLTISNGRHEWAADEPVSAGGRDVGPTPYDLLCSALGACVAITTRMYADRKGWPLEAITVDVRHGRVHANDCADCESEAGMIDHLYKTVHLAGDLDDAQLARLMQVADRCPVHRTLSREIRVVTTRG
jgi:putative redox protein